MRAAMKSFVKAGLLRTLWLLLAVFMSFSAAPVMAEEATQAGESTQILQAFNRQHRDAEHAKAISDKDKQKVMFILGALLIALVLATGALGIAMGIYGKPVFVSHMVCAGLSITLAIVHAIAGFVWFYPF